METNIRSIICGLVCVVIIVDVLLTHHKIFIGGSGDGGSGEKGVPVSYRTTTELSAYVPHNCNISLKPPKIFVYDIPRDMLDHDLVANLEAWDRLEYFMWKALLTYKHRTLNADEADFFFVPHLSSMVFHQSRYNSTESGRHFLRILEYVDETFPYMKRSSGADHVIAFAHDSWGNLIPAELMPLLPFSVRKNFILILNQGDAVLSDFNIRKDIVTIPTSWDPVRVWASHGLTRNPWAKRKHLAVFRGAINPDDLRYSSGVRQELFKQLSGDDEILYGEHNKTYAIELNEAKFCLFIKGWHVWSERLATIINAGCIPVIITGNYALPFWNQIDWSLISIRIPMTDAVHPGKLKTLLKAIPQAQAEAMEQRLADLRPSLTYNLPVKDGDIFSRILHGLQERLSRVQPRSGMQSWR